MLPQKKTDSLAALLFGEDSASAPQTTAQSPVPCEQPPEQPWPPDSVTPDNDTRYDPLYRALAAEGGSAASIQGQVNALSDVRDQGTRHGTHKGPSVWGVTHHQGGPCCGSLADHEDFLGWRAGSHSICARVPWSAGGPCAAGRHCRPMAASAVTQSSGGFLEKPAAGSRPARCREDSQRR